MEIRDNDQVIDALKLDPDQLRALLHPLRIKILLELIQPQYTASLAKKLKVSEQKLYYHVNILQKSGLIKTVGKQSKRGATAILYQTTSQAFGILLPGATSTPSPSIITSFKKALIIVGSPDPHGPHKTRARDNYYAAELGLFLGRFKPDIKVKTDTELKPGDKKRNLILIGGPVVNMITEKINDKLSIQFTIDNGNVLKSTITKKKYYDEEAGVIEIIDNPWAKDKKILVLAGKGFRGTKAAIVGFTKNYDQVKHWAKIVLGIDVDGDGIIDDVEFLE